MSDLEYEIDDDITRASLARLDEIAADVTKTIDPDDEPVSPEDIEALITRDPVAAHLYRQLSAAQAYAREIRSEREAAAETNTELAHAPTYRDFMDSEEWRRIADAAILRAGGACQTCKSSRDLQVHHNTYVRFGGRELETDLVCLCAGCHTIIHLARNLTDKLA